MEHSKIVTLGNGLQVKLIRPDLGVWHRVLNNNHSIGLLLLCDSEGFYVFIERTHIRQNNALVYIDILQEYSAALNEANKHAQEWQAEYENWKLNQKDHGI